MRFPDAADNSVQYVTKLPATLTGNITITLYWVNPSTATGDVRWTVTCDRAGTGER